MDRRMVLPRDLELHHVARRLVLQCVGLEVCMLVKAHSRLEVAGLTSVDFVVVLG